MANDLKIKGIANVAILQRFPDTFFQLTGLYTSIVDTNGEFVTSARGQCEFCLIMAGIEKKSNVSQCWNSNVSACQNVLTKKKPLIYQCYAGLTEIIVPILVNGKPIGAVITGQIRVQGKSPRSPSYRPQGKPMLVRKLDAAYKNVLEINESQLQAAADLLSLLINYIFKIEFELLTLSEVNRQCTYTQEIVGKATAFIDEHYAKRDITLNKVAEIVHLSPFYFSHIFKKELNTTFIDYLTKVRLREAVRLLKEDIQKSVKEIAFTIGYEDPYYFSKVFSKHYKVSPKQFREHYL